MCKFVSVFICMDSNRFYLTAKRKMTVFYKDDKSRFVLQFFDARSCVTGGKSIMLT